MNAALLFAAAILLGLCTCASASRPALVGGNRSNAGKLKAIKCAPGIMHCCACDVLPFEACQYYFFSVIFMCNICLHIVVLNPARLHMNDADNTARSFP